MPISPVAGVWRTFSPQQKTSGHCNRLDSEWSRAFEILHEIMRSLIESFCYSVWMVWWVFNIFIGDIFTRATHLVTTSQQYLWIIPEWRNKIEKRIEVPTDNNDDLFNIFIFNKISGAINNRRKNIINSMARNAIARSTYLWVAGRVFSLHVMRVKRAWVALTYYIYILLLPNDANDVAKNTKINDVAEQKPQNRQKKSNVTFVIGRSIQLINNVLSRHLSLVCIRKFFGT